MYPESFCKLVPAQMLERLMKRVRQGQKTVVTPGNRTQPLWIRSRSNTFPSFLTSGSSLTTRISCIRVAWGKLWAIGIKILWITTICLYQMLVFFSFFQNWGLNPGPQEVLYQLSRTLSVTNSVQAGLELAILLPTLPRWLGL